MGLVCLTHAISLKLANGPLIVANFGGHEYTESDGEATSDGLQGTRLFNPCMASENCDIYENPTVRPSDT